MKGILRIAGIFGCSFSIAFFSCAFVSAEEYPPNLKIDVVIPVWGRDFTDAFLKISLPLQLCPGNIGSLSPYSTRYRIFTTKQDWDYMQSDPGMKKLHELVSVDFVEITAPTDLPPATEENSPHYRTMTACHNRAIQEAKQDNRALILIHPDCLFSNNTFQTIVKNAMEGYRLILISAFDIKKEIVVPLLESVYLADSLYYNRNIYDCGLTGRQLIKLVLPFLHPLSESFIHNNKEINADPSYIIWKLDDENLLSTGYSCHPIFIWPETYVAFEGPIDYSFPQHACPSMQYWKVIQDSDEIAYFHFSYYRYRRILSMQMMPFNVHNIANWGKSRSSAPHYLFFSSHLVYTHSSDYKQEWKPIEKEASAFMQKFREAMK